MKITIEQATLLGAVRRAAACTAPISRRLEERLVRLAVRADGAVVVSGMDGVLAYETVLDEGVVTDGEGLLLCEGKALLARVGAMPPGELVLTRGAGKGSKAQVATLRSSTSARSFLLGVLPDKEAGDIRWDQEAVPFAMLPGHVLAAALARASWAADLSEADTLNNSVLVAVDRGRLHVSATNGRWLAVTEVAVEAPSGDPREAVLSLRGAKALGALGTQAGAAPLALFASPHQVVARHDRTRVGAATLNVAPRDAAPVLARLIAGVEPQEIVVDRKALIDAIGAARVVVDQTSDCLGIYLAAVSGALHVVGEGDGESRDALPTASPIAKPVWGQYLPSKLAEALHAAQGDTVSVALLEGPGNPLLITDVCDGIGLQAMLGGMAKHRSKTIDAILAAAKA